MLEKLFKLRSFLEDQNIEQGNLDWNFLEEYCNAFSPIYSATLRIQEKQLIPNEFYKIWMELKLKYDTNMIREICGKKLVRP